MTSQKAIICTAVGKVEVRTAPIPKPPEGFVLVKTTAIAVNPTDWKSIYNPQGLAVGTRPGVDFAGVVEQVGEGVTRAWKKGDKVCGSAFGTKDEESGAFAEYVLAKEHVLLRIPDHLSSEQASTLGVGITTCGQALYQLLGLPLPTLRAPPAGKSLFLNGGSTATATLGIQFAKLSGLHVIASASPYNFEYLKSLGADVLVDYHKDIEELAKEISMAAKGPLTLAWDCSPSDKSAEVAARAMSSAEKGIYATVDPFTPEDHLKAINPMVEAKFQLGYTIFGDEFVLGPATFPVSVEDVEFGTAFWERTAALLTDKKLQTTRITVNQGGAGLEGVLVGLDDLFQGKVAGTKLVYTMA